MTSPSTLTRCSVAVNGSGAVPAEGGTGSFSVSAARECAWSASVDGQWLSIKTGSTGQGDGAVEFTAAPNPDPAVRRGAVVLNEQRVEVMQAAGECSFSLSDSSTSFSQEGGSGRVGVRASSGLCTWTAESDASWIVVRSGGAGKGSAEVLYDVAPTAGPPRTGIIKAAGRQFSVTQSASCSFEISPESGSVSPAGGTGTVTVKAAAGCAWTAASNVPWISISGPSAGAGSGQVVFQATAGSAPRTGTLIVAGKTFTLTQAAGCSYSLSAASHRVPSEGGTGSVAVAAGPGCAWSAASNASWLTVTGGASGSGPGTVAFAASASAASRSGTMTIAGQTFTVTQSAGACTFSIAPEQQSMAAAGGTASIGVTSQAGCAWTAASNAAWIAVRSTGPENGSGTVQLTAAANTGAARVGTATIAGRTVTVSQAGATCTFKVSPLEMKVSDKARYEKVEVESSAACSWTAASNAAWIRVVWGAAGTGNGNVWLSVLENEGPERTGTVVVAGQTVIVNQKKD